MSLTLIQNKSEDQLAIYEKKGVPLICYGTRPEIIKMFPIINEYKRKNTPFKTLFSGQHKDILYQYSDLLPVPDFTLSTMEKGQSLNMLLAKILQETDNIFANNDISYVMIQGDTTTSYGIALSAFHHKIKIVHIEAGLRTHNKYSPFPEEMNRVMISKLTDIHFIPTEQAQKNLENEGHTKGLYLVGNTVIDAISSYHLKIEYKNMVLVTLHRRENVNNFEYLFNQINTLANEYKALHFMFIKHHSIPDSLYEKHIIEQNITLHNPFSYTSLLDILSKCLFVISDSGGIQEECTFYKKKILICRESTEREETVESGYGLLVGKEILENKNWIFKNPIINNPCPFGDGNSSKRIHQILSKLL